MQKNENLTLSPLTVENEDEIHTRILPIFLSDYYSFSIKKESDLSIVNKQNKMFVNQIQNYYPDVQIFRLGATKPMIESSFYGVHELKRIENLSGPKQKIFYRYIQDFKLPCFCVPGKFANEIFDLVLQNHFKFPESLTAPRFDLLLNIPCFYDYLLESESSLAEDFQRQQHVQKEMLQSNSLLNSSKLTIISNAQKKPKIFNPKANFNYDFELNQKTTTKPAYDFVTLQGER